MPLELPEISEPRANPDLIGHAAAEATLADAMQGGRMHHAWLIAGPEGIGKATLAFRFAKRLFAGPAGRSLYLPPDHPVFRRVAARTHADLLTIERAWDEKRKRMRGEIVVADARRATAFLHLTPAEAGWRVVLVDGAEDLNPSAANALLKIMEEPPRRAVLLLVCAAPGRLPPTIRSRCRRLLLEPLGPADLDAVLARLLPQLGPAERARAAAIAGGSPGRAVALAGEGGRADLVARLLQDVPGLQGERVFRRGLALADAIGRTEEAFDTVMELLLARLADIVRAGARDPAGVDPDAARLLAVRPLAAWSDVWQSLTRLRGETTGLHLDTSAALLNTVRLLAPP